MSKTMENLATAFSGESQANRKYLAFAAKAQSEGHRQAALMFKAAAEAETIHSLLEFKAMGMIKDTASNLKAAAAGETYEFTSMYPPFIEDAKAEGNKEAQRVFEFANEAEKIHAALYNEVLANLGKDDGDDFFYCTTCGHVYKGKEAPTECPICHSGKTAYKKAE